MKDLILRTAMRLFLEEGYEKVSMRRIADAIEYSPGTIYLYFRDKDEIMYALHSIAFRKFYQSLSVMAAEGSPYERLVNGGARYLDFALDNPELYELMFIMRAPARLIEKKGEEWEEGKRSYNLLRATVEEARDAGHFPSDVDLDAATLFIWSTVHGLASLAIRGRLEMFSGERMRDIMHNAMRTMLALSAESQRSDTGATEG